MNIEGVATYILLDTRSVYRYNEDGDHNEYQ